MTISATTTTSSTGTITSAGVGSGLDVETIVTKLMALENKPLDALKTEATTLNTQVSTFGKLQSALSTLRDASRALTDNTAWSSATATSSDSASVGATAGTGAVPGNYAVTVSKLAAPQSLTSGTLASSSTLVGTGSLTIELGTWSAGQTGFTPDSTATAVTISIGTGEDSLAQVRDKINAAGAGVTASIVTDSTGARLALRSTDTGEGHAFRITAADDDGTANDASGLSQLAFDPSAGINQLTQNQAASNATATINGISISSQSNTLTNVLDGLTVNLSRVTTGAVNIAVASDTDTIKKSITAFQGAYNDVVNMLRTQTNYDDTTKTGGPLQGDSTALAMLNRLRTLATGTSTAGTALKRLADIGLDPQRDGTLKLNDAKLTAALGNLPDLKKMFATTDTSDTTRNGFGTVFRQFSDQLLGTDGAIETRQDGLKRRLSYNTDSQSHQQDRLAMVEKRLRAQYTALDTSMAGITALQNYMTQQVTNWNKSTG